MFFAVFFAFCCLLQQYTDGQSSNWQPPRLVWVSYRNSDALASVQSVPADPDDYLSSGTVTSANHFSLGGSQWVAIGEHFSERKLYFSDLPNRGIIKGTFTQDNREDVAAFFVRGTSNVVDGVAVDWVTGNVYWTDVYYNWIKVIDREGDKHQVVVKTGLEKPRALALYPQRGLMFWSDWGREPKIEKSSLSGSNRQTLINSGLYFPNGLAIDYNTERLYWINVNPYTTSTISSSDFNGNGQQVLYSQSSADSWPFDLTIYQNYIFISDWANVIRCLFKSTGEQHFQLDFGTRPYGIAIYGDYNQPQAPSACDGDPCSDICVSDPTGYQCVCTEGGHLLEDGRTCQKDDTLQSPLLLWSTTDQICTLPVHMGDMHLPYDNYTYHCILSGQKHVVAMDADVHGQFLFYSDYLTGVISRVRLLDGETPEIIMGGVGSVEGIAVDWINSNLYWTDNTQQHIAVSRPDGSFRKILISNLDKPRSIVLDPIRNYMYWTDFGTSPKIERAGLDGNNRAVFYSNVVLPMGLAIDFKFERIYFADRGLQVLQSVDMNGGGVETIIQAPGAQFFDVDIFQDYVFWTQWNTDIGIQFANKEEKWYKRGLSHTGTAYGLRTYDNTRQPLVSGPCDTNNGGCEQLCLPRSTSGYICACGTGFILQSDGASCSPTTSAVLDNFILASDPHLHRIFQINLDSPSLEYSALPIGDALMDYPHGVDMDPSTQKIYWSDIGNKAIHTAMLDGAQSETIVQGELETPVGLAVDHITGLVYWSDSTLGKIEVAKLDGSNRKTLIEGIIQPRQILLDLEQRYLYWSDWGNDTVYGKIQRASQDGSNREDVISTDIQRPAGLAIDNNAGKFYWCDFLMNKIEVSDLTGQNRQTLVLLGDEARPFGLTLHSQFIYTSDWRKRGLERAYTSTGGLASVGYQHFAILYDLHAYSQSTIISGSNDCSLIDGGCSNLCLPTPSGRSCACPNGVQMNSDGITCYGVQRCPSQFLHGSVTSECRTLPGYSCSMLCDPGYELPSDTQITCLTTGQWDTDPSSLCQAKECPPLPVPNHTSTESCPQPSVYGIGCIHRCVIGYVIQSGDEERMCQADGSWSGETLVCHIQQCPPLSAPIKGFYTPPECSTNGRNYNEICQLSCLDGYQLDGMASQSCLATGLWSGTGSTPLCRDVAPPNFADSCPSDITVTAPSNELSAVVTWTAPTWSDNSGETPTVAANVVPPVQLSSGQHIITYTATDPSANSAVCSFTVTIQVLYCPQFPIPLNGYLDQPPCTTHYGSTCSVSCNEGYELHGSAVRTCEVDASNNPYWNGTDAECNIIECPESALPDGVVQTACMSPYTYGTECIYTCAVGYYQTGGETRRNCQADRTWSGSLIQCTIQSCDPLRPFANGDISPASCLTNGALYGDACHVTCKSGYQLQGAPSHTCQATGEWSDADDEHACEDITAPHFNGTCPEDQFIFADRGETTAAATWTDPVIYDNSGLALTVTSSKVNGVTLNEGPHTVVIYATDQAGNQATCRFIITVIVKRCPTLSIPQYGSIVNMCANHFGSECQIACNVGYTLTGSELRVCESSVDSGNGQWTGVDTVCQIVECTQLPVPTNSMVQGCDVNMDFLPYNTRCQYHCKLGYERISGSTERTCQGNATWSGQDMICQIKTCEGLTPPENGNVVPYSCLSQSNYGDQCVYNCSDGYQVMGPPSRQCLQDSTWSLSEQPAICQDVEPPSFGESCPMDMMVTTHECSTSGLVDYTHPTATDNDEVVFEDGPYSVSLPANWTAGLHSQVYQARDTAGLVGQCQFTVNVQVVECPQLLGPVNGAIVSQSCQNMYGTVAQLKCHAGFSLVGDDELRCGVDGQWIGTVPYCQAITCPTFLSPDFGSTAPSECTTSNEVQYGTVCTIQCDSGFVLDGASQSTCGGNGSWSRDLTVSFCRDVTPPSFGETCPPSTITPLVLPQGSATIEASWEIPMATDNSGQVTVIGPEGIAPPFELGPGRTFFLYTGRDSSNLTTVCSFFVEVVDEEPPFATNCTESYEIESPTMPVELHWPQPVFTDNVKVARVLSDKTPGFTVIRWDVYTVTHTAYDDAGNVGYCVTNITVLGKKKCPPLTPPVHGALACDTTSLCSIFCNADFYIKRRPESLYTCLVGDDSPTGFWSHGNQLNPAPGLPPCESPGRRNRKPNWSVGHYETQFDYHHLDGQCEDLMDEIKQKFADFVRNSVFGETGYCDIDPDFCNEDKTSVNCSDVVRRRRSADLGSSDEHKKKFEDMVMTLNSSSNVTLKVNGQDTVLNTGESRIHYQPQCDPGYILDMDECMSCPVGTYHDPDSADCIRCPKSYYQDEEAQSQCKRCPGNSTTLGDGIFTKSDCYEICPAGSFSYLGIAPCQQCLLGSYQPDPQQTYCIACPKWHTTLSLGATSQDQCTALVPLHAPEEKGTELNIITGTPSQNPLADDTLATLKRNKLSLEGAIAKP